MTRNEKKSKRLDKTGEITMVIGVQFLKMSNRLIGKISVIIYM